MARILFTFNKDGTVKVEPQGYGGELCKTVTAPYEKALGVLAERQQTSEAQDPPIAVQTPVEQEQKIEQ